MVCKDCEYFNILNKPSELHKYGQALCKKYDIIISFSEEEKLKHMICEPKNKVKRRK